MVPPPPGDPVQTNRNPLPQGPMLVQIDPKCLHSALKEFFDPLRTNDSRTDFFAMYRKESEEFDRDYAGKYDEDLNTSLIFAGLFSAVSSAFIIDVQSNLQPDPNEMTAAYLRILIHNMNNTLFPDANSTSAAWTGPPPEIVTVQSLLYSSLATSLFAAFIAMLGKQWVTRYLRRQGGSAVEKSRDRQRKLDGFKQWNFQFAIESLPVMLQLALLLLGSGLTLYLWTISRTIAGVVLAFTLLGVASYSFFTLAAMFHYNCPYQTPLSIFIRTIIRHLAQSNLAFIRSLRSLISYVRNLRRLLLSGLRRALQCFHCGSTVEEEVEGIVRADVVVAPTRIFEDVPVNWEVCEGDSRCIWWALDYTTDADVIFTTARFAADMIWYPEVVGSVSPHVLANLFFDCLSDGQVIPGKSEYATAIGMALASVLSMHLATEPRSLGFRELRLRLWNGTRKAFSSDPTCLLVMNVLGSFGFTHHDFIFGPWPTDRLSATNKLWLGRVVLQHVWRRRLFVGPTAVLSPPPLLFLYKGSTTDGEDTLFILKTNCFLTAAISLGLRVENRDLYPPNTVEALQKAATHFYERLQTTIRWGDASQEDAIVKVLSSLIGLDPFEPMQREDNSFPFIADILGSSFSEKGRYRMANEVVLLLGRFFFPNKDEEDIRIREFPVRPEWISHLLDFLSLSEKFYATESPPYAGSIALRFISAAYTNTNIYEFNPDSACFDTYFFYTHGFDRANTAVLPILSSMLLPTHPLQSRGLALNALQASLLQLFLSETADVARFPKDIAAEEFKSLLQAVGDPFLFTRDISLLDRRTGTFKPDYEPADIAVLLIQFASSGLWRNHLQPSNFTTCEKFLSTGEGKMVVIESLLKSPLPPWLKPLCMATKAVAAIRRLEELQCLSTAEVVIMWAWTVGGFDAEGHDDWGLIERITFLFYQAHGTGRLKALERHITNVSTEVAILGFIRREYREPGPFRKFSVRQPPDGVSVEEWLRTSQVRQLERLYRLFGCDPTTWKETVAGEREGKETELSSAVAPVSFVDWACDYP